MKVKKCPCKENPFDDIIYNAKTLHYHSMDIIDSIPKEKDDDDGSDFENNDDNNDASRYNRFCIHDYGYSYRYSITKSLFDVRCFFFFQEEIFCNTRVYKCTEHVVWKDVQPGSLIQIRYEM